MNRRWRHQLLSLTTAIPPPHHHHHHLHHHHHHPPPSPPPPTTTTHHPLPPRQCPPPPPPRWSPRTGSGSISCSPPSPTRPSPSRWGLGSSPPLLSSSPHLLISSSPPLLLSPSPPLLSSSLVESKALAHGAPRFPPGRWTSRRPGSGPTGTSRNLHQPPPPRPSLLPLRETKEFFLQFSFKLSDPRGGSRPPPPAVAPAPPRPAPPPAALPPPPTPPGPAQANPPPPSAD